MPLNFLELFLDLILYIDHPKRISFTSLLEPCSSTNIKVLFSFIIIDFPDLISLFIQEIPVSNLLNIDSFLIQVVNENEESKTVTNLHHEILSIVWVGEPFSEL